MERRRKSIKSMQAYIDLKQQADTDVATLLFILHRAPFFGDPVLVSQLLYLLASNSIHNIIMYLVCRCSKATIAGCYMVMMTPSSSSTQSVSSCKTLTLACRTWSQVWGCHRKPWPVAGNPISPVAQQPCSEASSALLHLVLGCSKLFRVVAIGLNVSCRFWSVPKIFLDACVCSNASANAEALAVVWYCFISFSKWQS